MKLSIEISYVLKILNIEFIMDFRSWYTVLGKLRFSPIFPILMIFVISKESIKIYETFIMHL